jgi:hypothetical protein
MTNININLLYKGGDINRGDLLLCDFVRSIII